MSDNNNNVPPIKKQKTVDKKLHCDHSSYKCKNKSDLKKHDNVHNLGVVWHYCVY